VGRFDAFSTILRLALDSLGIQPQPWMGVAALSVGTILILPALIRNARTDRARKLLIGLLDLDADAREARVRKLLGLVEGNPHGLVSVADRALDRGHRAVALRAYEQLRRTPGAPRADVMRLDEKLFGPPPRHAEAEAAAIERLIEAGALLRATERLRRARAWFPADASLQALQRRLDATPSGPRGG